MARTALDLASQRFGYLTAVERVGTQGTKALWRCLCDCGRYRDCSSSDLRSGRFKHCGCKTSEAISSAKLMSTRLSSDPGLNCFYRRYILSAAKRGYEVSITVEEVETVILQPCHYCGSAPADRVVGNGHVRAYNGIDRVDNSVGYKPENVVSCCFACNRMKSTLSYQEFMCKVFSISAHLRMT